MEDELGMLVARGVLEGWGIDARQYATTYSVIWAKEGDPSEGMVQDFTSLDRESAARDAVLFGRWLVGCVERKLVPGLCPKCGGAMRLSWLREENVATSDGVKGDGLSEACTVCWWSHRRPALDNGEGGGSDD